MLRLLLLFSSLACISSAVAVELENIRVDTLFSYQYDTSSNESLALLGIIQPEWDLQLTEQLSARLSGRLILEQQDRLDPGEPNLNNYDGATRPHIINERASIEALDVYLELALPDGLLRLGKQQIVWGELDGLKVLDALNPQSFEEFILADFDVSRISLWSAYLDYSVAGWRIEAALSADTTTHYLPPEDAFYALTAPRYRLGLSGPSPLPQTYSGSEDNRGTAGLRISRYVGGFDVQLVALSADDFEPLGRFAQTPAGPVIEIYHERRELYGLAAAGSVGKFAFRGEISFTPDKWFNTNTGTDLDVLQLDQWRGAIGIDYAAPWDIFVNVQYLRDEVQNAPDELVRPQVDEIVTVFVRKQFLYETLTAEVRYYTSLRYDDALTRGRVSYALSDHATVSLVYDGFSGNELGPFGQFAERDRVGMTLEYTF
ncbi:MAG: DUF1302 family protein [Pseudomonadota bacterium]